jgi:hypothetical protein
MEFEVLLKRIVKLEKACEDVTKNTQTELLHLYAKIAKIEEQMKREITGWEDVDNSKKTTGWGYADQQKNNISKQRGYTGWS